jgi:hypothetical protein
MRGDSERPPILATSSSARSSAASISARPEVPQLTVEDYVNSRYVLNPLRLWDCDRPVNASAVYLFTTAERACDMRQPPVYVLNHSQHNSGSAAHRKIWSRSRTGPTAPP